MAIDKNNFPDNRTRIFVPYKGWLVVDSEGTQNQDYLTKDSQSLGPLTRISVRPKDCNSHWTYNLLDKDNEPILPKNCRKINWYQQGYYIAYFNNEDDIYDPSIGGFLSKDFRHGYWVVKEDSSLLSKNPFLKAEPTTFGRIFVTEERREYILSLDGSIAPIPMIRPIGVSGWYIFGSGNDCKIIDHKGNLIVSGIEVITFDSELIIIRYGDRLQVYDYTGKIIGTEFTSMLYSEGSIWNIRFCHLAHPQVTFLHGQTKNEILDYAQQILISNDKLALLEKDGIWYYYDSRHQLVECFKFNPNNILLP